MAARIIMRVEGDDVALAQKGDAGAFERLYRASVSRIHSLARRMAGDGAADDLTQEVFIRAWQKLPTFRGESAFDTWLHRLAVNLILTRRQSLRKRESRQVGGPELLESFAGRAGVPGFAVDFERALEVLPAGAREVFVLYDGVRSVRCRGIQPSGDCGSHGHYDGHLEVTASSSPHDAVVLHDMTARGTGE